MALEDTTLVNENDSESDEDEFVFHQIDELQTWCHDNEDLRTLGDAGNGDWMKTEFAEVMRLFRRSEANGIYIIYNIYSDHSFTGDTSHHYTGIPGDTLGRRKWSFRVRKLQIKYLTLICFVHMSLRPPIEIICVIESGSGNMVRGTVATSTQDKSTWESAASTNNSSIYS